jgi:hypothetical protein
MIQLPHAVPMERVVENSFKDYHVRGFDYLCLKRSPKETVKLYFFDGDVSSLPEVVTPHDHRYDFDTHVLCGESQNVWFRETNRPDQGSLFERFAYETPLCGGDGFTHVGQTRLIESVRASYRAGGRYQMKFNEVHTIRMLSNETVLCLIQYEDRVNDRPTLTFCRDQEPPSLSGLYRKFSPDEVTALLERLASRAPNLKLPRIL